MSPAPALTLVVDCANVVGSRPDGWWRDRAGANTRLLERLAALCEETVPGPGGSAVRIAAVLAVVEGRARDVAGPATVHLVRAEADGDTAVVQAARQVLAGGGAALVVTADRGLRERLDEGVAVTGPGWLLALLDTHRT